MATVFLSNEKSFDASMDISMLEAARMAGLVLEHSCRTGRCGTCKARVLRGLTKVIGDTSGLTDAEQADGVILTCTTAAVDEVHLDIEDVSLLADFPTRTSPCRIDVIERLTSDVVRVLLRFPPKASPNYLPGQYMDVLGPNGIRRSYSIANMPTVDGKVELHVREVPGGAMSTYWFGPAKVNDLLRIEGPKGSFFLRDVTDLDVIFLATGTGIAPIKAMLEGLGQRVAAGLPRSVSVYWGGRHEADLYWPVAATKLASFEYIPVLSRAADGWSGARGHVQDVLVHRAPNWPNVVVYACGSEAMIRSASSELSRAGLPPKRFFSDAFVSSSV